MTDHKEKIWVGFIAYGESTLKYLPYFLDSLAGQTGVELKVVAFDNTETDSANFDYLHSRSEVEVLSAGRNLGFGKAYNLMIARAVSDGARYFFVVNPDIILEASAISVLAGVLDADSSLSSACPKLRRWNFEKSEKTDMIDSCGIVLRPSLQFFDLGQGENDDGQYDKADILGPSGAAGLFRLESLEGIKEEGQYFDEHFFMYKEDCDLAMRLVLRGSKSRLVASAVGYHDRTAAGKGEGLLSRISSRSGKSRLVRSWSFVNQQLIYCKYWRTLGFIEKLRLVRQQCYLLAYVCLFEPYLLLELRQIAIKRRGLKYYE
ncbi:glycosyltransferase [Candidatus Falkowbacteria bacterium]|nr:glycosyltransferase [Candidatus Falkowbacteria bacterium]